MRQKGIFIQNLLVVMCSSIFLAMELFAEGGVIYKNFFGNEPLRPIARLNFENDKEIYSEPQSTLDKKEKIREENYCSIFGGILLPSIEWKSIQYRFGFAGAVIIPSLLTVSSDEKKKPIFDQEVLNDVAQQREFYHELQVLFFPFLTPEIQFVQQAKRRGELVNSETSYVSSTYNTWMLPSLNFHLSDVHHIKIFEVFRSRSSKENLESNGDNFLQFYNNWGASYLAYFSSRAIKLQVIRDSFAHSDPWLDFDKTSYSAEYSERVYSILSANLLVGTANTHFLLPLMKSTPCDRSNESKIDKSNYIPTACYRKNDKYFASAELQLDFNASKRVGLRYSWSGHGPSTLKEYDTENEIIAFTLSYALPNMKENTFNNGFHHEPDSRIPTLSR